MALFSRMLLLATIGVPAAAHADRWFVAEAPAAIAVSDPQAALFHAGIMPAVGAYADNGTLALGVRLRAGVLRNGAAPAQHLGDPGLGGLGTAGLAVRIASHGLWIEGVAGGGITGHDLVPTFEAGAGWELTAGSIELGPSARYVRVISRDPMGSLGDAELLLIGIDVRFGKARAAPRPPVVRPMTRSAPVEPAQISQARQVAVDRDGDRVIDREASCATDLDGCEIAHQIFVHDDRIVLDERVLFDVDRAYVRPAGRGVIDQIAAAWHAHPEWLRLTIEGHADVRGTDEYNLELSLRRAEHVRDYLVRGGFAPAQVSVIGYGRTRPLDPRSSASAHQRNRRVEFVIEREQTTREMSSNTAPRSSSVHRGVSR